MKRSTRAWVLLLVMIVVASTSRGSAGSVPCEGVFAVNVTTGGSGYAAGDVGQPVTLSGGGGTGATAFISAVNSGSVTGVVISNFGAGYTSAPAAAISAPLGGGSTATGTALVAPPCPCGTVAGVGITNGGSGYTNGDLAHAVTFSGGGGSGATAIISLVSSGSVTQVFVSSGGTGYGSPPAVAISSPTAGGVTATGTAVLGPCGVPTFSLAPLLLCGILLAAGGAFFLIRAGTSLPPGA